MNMKPLKTQEQIQEALDILQEECAEAVVEVSKCRRFGFDDLHYKSGVSHRTHLEMELGDVLAMIDILVEQGVVDRDGLEVAADNKKLKLQQWSNIYGKCVGF
jgi:NTP pyrophosphatase (non-canonical NTP hydrolase)